MNALELLHQDHEKVSALFEKAEATENEKQKQTLFKQIASELEMHTHIEETVFYPAIRENEELKDLVLEAFEEHRQVKNLIREINNLTDGSEKFDAKLKVMKENVEHHVEEEESEMFPLVEQIMNKSELEELGAAMEQEKRQAGGQQGRSSKSGTQK